MSLIETKWTRGDYIPKADLLAWHSADTTTTPNLVPDLSGNARDMESELPTPTLGLVSGYQAVNFDGVNDNALVFSGSLTPKHVFVIAAYADAGFPSGDLGNGGLLTGATTGSILVGSVSSTKFYDHNYDASGEFGYRRRDVAFAETDMQGSFNNEISIFELTRPDGWGLDAIQVGFDRSFPDRRWKGPWYEHILYGAIKNDAERQRIYEYAAMKYLLWKKVASGLNVWPFQPNWGRSLDNDKLVLSSRSVSGSTTARSKSIAKKGFESQFEDREPEEYDTAVEFWDEHYPGSSFIYRDDAFVPSRDTEVLFSSPLSQRQGNHRQINYSIQAVEV